MAKKLFSFKMEELPAIGDFILSRVKKDLNDFSGFSSVFTLDYLAPIEAKNAAFKKLTGSSLVSKELKATTQQLKDVCVGLRVKLNILEGYLTLGASGLDISVADMGLKSIRQNISRRNIEGFIANMQKTLTAVKRNLPALEATGLNAELLNELEAEVEKIESLNIRQNDLISDRNRLTEKNVNQANDLWKSLLPILKTAKAIYRSVDTAKLKDYTTAQLVKRVNAERQKKETVNREPGEES
jgi:hypothetical protein